VKPSTGDHTSGSNSSETILTPPLRRRARISA
jgi:hypothetical protein